ncbi:mercury(II) reductase [Desulfuromonas versatilis]|uniref:Mercury(II) reductase n=1 Tax=Desulfuromonas versatilis TaxID=2802975 RepID=A0ABM8I1T7_9BACT|nr:FAD-dependent oxidoreductase [Desulfuromonas versatilis]BCR06954.1 mercury(II) reductase [Desulfuromonas versatilis]
MNSGQDIVILGSGTTAFAAALKASQLGAQVLMVEQSHLGGTCVNWGCIPSKTLIHKAEAYFEARRGEPYGLNLNAAPVDCGQLMAAKNAAVKTLRREHYQKVLDQNKDIHVLRGHGRFLSPREMQVGAEILVSDRFLIACGGIPRTLQIPGLSEVGYLNSYSALHLPCFPPSLLIIGGGVIALEMGQMFARFGTRVTILERGDRTLKEFDPRLTGIFEDVLRQEGVELVFGVQSRRAFREAGESCLEVEVEGEQRIYRAEQIMLAVGTAPATEGIGLAEAGVQINDAGFITTDEECRTTAPGIWAAGDVTGPPLIAPAGAREGEVAIENMLDPARHRRIDHRNTPMAVFVDPEFATVGLSPDQARLAGKDVVETWLDLQQVAKAHVMGGRRGGILLCAEQGSGRVLGVQLLAPRAADIIHQATLAVRFGLTVFDLAETVHVYPTISDGLRLAALDNVRRQTAP